MGLERTDDQRWYAQNVSRQVRIFFGFERTDRWSEDLVVRFPGGPSDAFKSRSRKSERSENLRSERTDVSSKSWVGRVRPNFVVH